MFRRSDHTVAAYTVLGGLFGLAFPILSFFVDWFTNRQDFISELARLSLNPVHYIVATAPIILALVFSVIGRMQSRQIFANTLLSTSMESSLDAILVVDGTAKILSFNTHFAEMWGVSRDWLAAGDDAPILKAVAGAMKDPPAFVERVKHLYAHPEEDGHDELETKDGRIIDRHTGVLWTAGRYVGRVWFFRDITEEKNAQTQLMRSARTDALTGLANRTAFMDAVKSATAIAQRDGPAFAVLYIDLDHFKDVNDTLGHPVGDALLQAVADRLRRNTRKGDVVARFGGDEFAILVHDIDAPDEAAMIADKLIEAMNEPFLIDGNDIRNGASVGISIFGPQTRNVETLMSEADLALYRAKSEDRGRYQFFTQSLASEVTERVKLGNELRDAVAGNQLFLVYQPQVDLNSLAVIGVEALVRWQHPQRGVLYPNTFIPLAEKNGLIVAIGQWVLEEAMRQMKAWREKGIAPQSIAVNLSAVQFKNHLELERSVDAALAKNGIEPGCLELELTESILMATRKESTDTLQRFRQRGIRLAIDDFGIGYSSLDYLRKFPVDRIKIAREFVDRITAEPESAAIVRATIGLARELAIGVIAEGIETPDQGELLTEWGCTDGQGYYFSRPEIAKDIAILLNKGHLDLGAPMRKNRSA